MIVRLLEDALGIELRAAGFPASLEPAEEEKEEEGRNAPSDRAD
jgi:hypothetical protein